MTQGPMDAQEHFLCDFLCVAGEPLPEDRDCQAEHRVAVSADELGEGFLVTALPKPGDENLISVHDPVRLSGRDQEVEQHQPDAHNHRKRQGPIGVIAVHEAERDHRTSAEAAENDPEKNQDNSRVRGLSR